MDSELASAVSRPQKVVSSFSDFYRSEYRAVARLAYVLTGDHHAAEDLAQEAFVTAQKNWPKVCSYESPEGWLRRVLINRARSRFRRLGRERGAMHRIWSNERSEPPPGLETDAIDLWREVRNLPRRQAQAIALTYLDGLRTAEVGEIIGCSAATVKTHLQRGKRTLARQLGDEGRVQS
jgi:RNA polymerase sigma-70 factor (ECF subfamily)